MTSQEHNFHPTYRPDIDGLRAIAILSVVLFHAFPSALRGGFTGVDIFFVISGFLISSIIFRSLQHGSFSFTEFYAHRIKRIFPALVVVLVASYAFGWFALLADEYKQLGKHIAAGAGFIQNFALLQEAGYFDTASEQKPLMHLWSLAIEEQFYLLYPLLIWGIWKLRFNVLGVVLAVGLLSFGANILGMSDGAVRVFFAPHTRFWELFAGAVLAYLHHSRQSYPAANRKAALQNFFAFAGMALLAVAVFWVDKGKPFPGWWALAPVAGTFLLIMAGPQAWINQKLLASKPMVFIGLISYPLYLWHWPILSFLRIVEPEAPSAGVRVAAVGLSLIFAWLTYRLVERPIRFGRKTWIKTAALTVLMVVTGYVGFTTYQKEGLPERHEKFLSMPGQLGKAFKLGQRADEATVMLLGDSHAGHLAGALMELGNQVADYTGLGCIPFYNVDRYDSRFPPGACRARVNASIELFEESEKFNTIILASMGPVYLTGEAFMGMDEARVTGLTVTISNHPEMIDRWKIYEIGMRETLDRLLAKNKKIIFVLDVPELGFQPGTCIDNRPLRIIGKAARKPCAVSREAFENRAGRYRRLVADILKDYPQVELYDPVKVLCDEKWCWAMKDGLMLYRDFDHLSLDGGRYIGQTLNPLIRKVANLE